MKTLVCVSVVLLFVLSGCGREQPSGSPIQGQPGGDSKRLTEKVEKLEKQLAEKSLEITALKVESAVMDKQMAAVLSILKEWSVNQCSADFERAAKSNPVLAWQLLRATASLTDAQLQQLTNDRNKFRRDVESAWATYEAAKSK